MNEGSPTQAGTATEHPAGARQALRDAVFYTLFYAFLWQMVGMHLIFHGAGRITNFPSFYTTWGFFAEHLSEPGGPVEYLSAFLSQLFYSSWLGALVVTTQAWLLGLCTACLARAASLKRGAAIRYIPALLLAVLHGRYTYFLPTTMALLVALLCACSYVAAARRRTGTIRFAAFALLSLLCYYTAGGAFLLFALVCVIYEALIARRWQGSLGYAAFAAALPFALGGLVFSLADVYSKSLPISWTLLYYESRRRWIELVYALYLLAPVSLLIAGLWSVRKSASPQPQAQTPVKGRKKGAGKGSRPFDRVLLWYRQSPGLGWTLETTLVLAVGAAVALGGLDRKQRNFFTVDYYAYYKIWPEVLTAGRRQVNDRFVMHAVDRALYETGRLGEEMFRWPQRPEFLFLTDVPRKQAHWATFDLYLEMGLPNAAEHALTECLEGLGDRPLVLQPLALVNLVKGNVGTARIYLGALTRTLFHRAWAEQYLALLDTDPNLTTDQRVQQLRARILEKEFPSVAPPSPGMFLGLLEKDPGNRITFEYMMASHLLNKRLATFANYVPYFERIGYPTVPTYFEEAALTYVYGTRKPLHMGNYQPRPELRRQTESILGILTRYGGDKRAALSELTPKYRNTYMFYYLYAPPGQEQ